MPNYLEKKITEVQSVVKFFEDPCQAPWTVYLELAVAPAGHVVMELLSFGLDDIVRGFFRPKGLYRRQRTGRLARKLGKYFEIPEIGEMIGAHLPFADIVKSRKISNGVRFMWIVDGVLQRVLFWWMVADLLTDFLYEWTSAINRTEFCHSRVQGGVTCPILPNTIIPQQWVTLGPDLRHCEKNWGDVSMGDNRMPSFGRHGWGVAGVQFAPFIGVCGGALVRVVDGDDRVLDERTATNEPDGSLSAIVRAPASGNRFSYVQAKAIGDPPFCTAMRVTGGSMTGFAY